ncbi:OST-HTH/LOTUS domain-containing protein [Ferribacterium limneticum]|uniref:OST-HTH/LOTUS domain-containing protein n=1 Tax=Ferribacterium limneticum TaxID=76259 RepID=UPI001CF8FB70|nr:OST-HTH/LOTUS domain-containing protein [Ferribacterium limneticum]UCV23827.1 OST-HTH/LOTUS domain-containing protein [Ferribacterium limneticum]
MQQLELLVKALWIDSEHESAFGQVEEIQAAQLRRKEFVSDKTLGTVLKSFVGSYIAPDLGKDAGDGVSASVIDKKMLFRYKSKISMAEDDYARTVQEFEALVAMRNDLVHHFIERFNLWSDEGCEAAEAHLNSCDQQIESQLSIMHAWVKSHQEARDRTLALVNSDDFLVFLSHGEQSCRPIDWADTPIVKILFEAESRIAKDGWVSLVDAISWMAIEYPNEKPMLYGCSRWRHLLHETQLFEVSREVPPINSATGNLVKSVFEKENGLEEAVFRRADHRFLAAGGSRNTDQGAVPATWLQ